MSITGEEHGGPLRAGVAMADLSTGMYATVSILMALRHAERTGQGQQIDVSLLDTQIAMLANQGSSWLVGEVNPSRLGNRHPTVVPYKTFEVTDGIMIIAIGNDGQFRALCRVLDVEPLSADDRFATNPARVAHREELRNELEKALGARGASAWHASLTAAGVPCGPINDVAGAFDLATSLGLSPVVAVPGSPVPQVANPLRMSATPPSYRTPPPALPPVRP